MFKKSVKERDGAMSVIEAILSDVRDAWRSTEQEFRRAIQMTHHGNFTFLDDERAQFDLTLAVIAFESEALPNLFPADQAQRLYELTYELVDTPELGDYATTELTSYHQAFEKCLDQGRFQVDAYKAVAARLLKVSEVPLEVGGGVTHFRPPAPS